MREIKFRAWDIENKRMYDVKSVTYDHCNAIMYWRSPYENEKAQFVHKGLRLETECIPMQFTGLRNIYEDDIAQIGSDLYRVYWNSELLQWRMRFVGTKRTNADDIEWTKKEGFLKVWGDLPLAGDVSADSIVIIGNAHDNPDLLK